MIEVASDAFLHESMQGTVTSFGSVQQAGNNRGQDAVNGLREREGKGGGEQKGIRDLGYESESMRQSESISH